MRLGVLPAARIAFGQSGTGQIPRGCLARFMVLWAGWHWQSGSTSGNLTEAAITARFTAASLSPSGTARNPVQAHRIGGQTFFSGHVIRFDVYQCLNVLSDLNLLPWNRG
jgi:hypothetical protein